MVIQLILPLILGLGIGLATQPISQPLQIATNRGLQLAVPQTNDLINLKFRNIISEAEFLDFNKNNGFSEDRSRELLQGQQTLLDINENVRLFRRGLLAQTSEANREAYFANLAKIGVTEATANKLLDALEVIETPQQLVVFLVREIFNEELRTKFEVDSEFPNAALGEFAKIGIREQLARRIWAAHWELPPTNQVQEMFYRYRPKDKEFWESEVNALDLQPDRVETTKETFQQLLKAADVMPFWRDRVTAILFQNLGQIQLRWAIRFRFFGFKEAVYQHERQGLPPTLAKRVTQIVFVIQSIADWRQGIKQGVFTFDDVVLELSEWEITDSRIVNIVKRKVAPEVAEGVEDERKLTKKLILDAFDLNQTNRTETIDGLQNIGYSEDQAKFIFEVHEAEKQVSAAKKGKVTTTTTRVKGLTKSDIKKAFREGVFTEEEAIQELVDIGTDREAAMIIIELERPE